MNYHIQLLGGKVIIRIRLWRMTVTIEIPP